MPVGVQAPRANKKPAVAGFLVLIVVSNRCNEPSYSAA